MMPILQRVMAGWLMLWLLTWPVGCANMTPNVDDDPPEPLSVPQPLDSGPQKTPSSEDSARQRMPRKDYPTPNVAHSAESKAPPFFHKVRWPRETIYSMARWYTGSGKHWKSLVAANPTIEPRRLRNGDRVRIPEELLRTREPMPAAFISSTSRPKPEVVSIDPKPTSESIDKSLFGPIEHDGPATPPPGIDLPVPLETLNEDF